MVADRSGSTFGTRRDIYRSLGYRATLGPKDYWDRYQRGGIARRIVETFPKSTWRGGAVIIESEEEKDTKFEKAVVSLDKRLNLWQTFQRADVLAGLGRFSLIVLGGPGPLEKELKKCPPDSLKYLAVLSEKDVVIDSLVEDPKDPRYGFPEFYNVTFATTQANRRPKDFSGKIHWSRVGVHVVEGAMDNPLYGPPRLEAVWNYLDDLTKVVGGGSEAFWKRVDGGKQLKLDPTLPLPTEAQKAELHGQIEEYTHELRRVLTTRGVDIEDLGTNVSSFGPQVQALMDLIAATTGIPQRILMGSERGELASTTDQSNYDDRIEDRRNYFAEPSVVRPFVQRLIDLGTLPEPKEFYVRWPEIRNLNDAQRMALGIQAADLNAKAGETIITPAEIRDKILGFPPLTEEQIKAEQDKAAKKQAEAMGVPTGDEALFPEEDSDPNAAAPGTVKANGKGKIAPKGTVPMPRAASASDALGHALAAALVADDYDLAQTLVVEALHAD
jgi:hypothetical protein